jgi:dephospho-CoA kinase
MYVLGITGGIGSGKTTAADLLGELGAVVIHLDDLAKRMIGPDGPLVEDVITAFGENVRGTGGGVDTAALAACAFETREAADRLDRIVHPGVYAAVAGALDALLELAEPPEVVVIDIPLLVESPIFFDLLDGVLAVSAPEDVRFARLEARGMDPDDVRARMALQVSDAERRDVADYVVENDCDKPAFESALVAFWDDELAHRGA